MQANVRTGQSVWQWGITLLRIVVGIVFVMHGQQKLFEMGVGGVGGFFASLGVPAPQLLAVVVSLLETVGGLALILGVLTRLFGLLLAGDMLVALLLVHRPEWVLRWERWRRARSPPGGCRSYPGADRAWRTGTRQPAAI